MISNGRLRTKDSIPDFRLCLNEPRIELPICIVDEDIVEEDRKETANASE